MPRKMGFFLLYLCIFFLIYYYQNNLILWLGQADVTYIPVTLVLATMLSLFPIIPYPLVGAVIGATYGSLLGGIITWGGSTMASIIMFILVRYILQDWGQKFLHKYKSLSKFTLIYEKNAFLAILFGRMVPVIPSIIINIYSALSRTGFVVYFTASAIGKLPAMLLFALVGDQWMQNPVTIVFIILFYLLFTAVVYTIYRAWSKNKKGLSRKSVKIDFL